MNISAYVLQALHSHQKAGGSKAVIFSQFTGMLNLVDAALRCASPHQMAVSTTGNECP